MDTGSLAGMTNHFLTLFKILEKELYIFFFIININKQYVHILV